MKQGGESMVMLTDEQADALADVLNFWAEYGEGLSYPDWIELETQIALETLRAGDRTWTAPWDETNI